MQTAAREAGYDPAYGDGKFDDFLSLIMKDLPPVKSALEDSDLASGIAARTIVPQKDPSEDHDRGEGPRGWDKLIVHSHDLHAEMSDEENELSR